MSDRLTPRQASRVLFAACSLQFDGVEPDTGDAYTDRVARAIVLTSNTMESNPGKAIQSARDEMVEFCRRVARAARRPDESGDDFYDALAQGR